MAYASEAQRWGLAKESVRLTAEVTPTSWIAVDPSSNMDNSLALLPDKAIRGVKAQYPSFAGMKTVGGKIKMPCRALNMGELLHMAFGDPSSAQETAFLVTVGVNDKIDFVEGAGAEQHATLTPGVYTSTTLATEIKTQMETANGTAVTYTVTYSTTTKKFTIAPSASTVKIKWLTGTNTATNAHAVMGFTNADTALAASVTSDSTVDFGMKHTFSLPTSILPPTYTVFVDRSLNVMGYNGCAVKKLSFNGPAEGYAELEAEILGLAEASNSIGSPAYTETDPLEFYQSTIKIDGAADTNITDWKLNIETGLQHKRQMNNSQVPANVVAVGKWKVSGEFGIYFETAAQRASFLANTTITLRMLIEGALIGTSATIKNTLDLNLYKCHYKAFPYGDDKGLLHARAQFECTYDAVTASKMIQCDLTNVKAAY